MHQTPSRLSHHVLNAAAYLLFVVLVGCTGWLEVNLGAAGSFWQDLEAAYLPAGDDPLVASENGWLEAEASAPASGTAPAGEAGAPLATRQAPASAWIRRDPATQPTLPQRLDSARALHPIPTGKAASGSATSRRQARLDSAPSDRGEFRASAPLERNPSGQRFTF
ncbi:hypothetical protein [Pseudomonas sp. RIT-PI-AD]|uniref:hypothetical protein n=1 Tax=Pseudomonas sp. RIT-PI-AD TaxID=3035294 RepID=UPI0021D8AB12|nr:hypothetical protein [Pseudomonas sp. RIT-PI-AD]